MVIKESSDELNPPQLKAESIVVRPQRATSAIDYVALAIATWGVGYLPIAPGTWGSMVGVVLSIGLRAFFVRQLWPRATGHTEYSLVVVELVVVFTVALIGIWAASRTEKLSGKKDPGKVVVDEVAGQMLALTAVPLAVQTWWTIVLAFGVFRFFDIVKPYPARRLESLESGLGIMADDIVAGAYAALVVGVVVFIHWLV
jgi:phosphatidylglycerophosphatase A